MIYATRRAIWQPSAGAANDLSIAGFAPRVHGAHDHDGVDFPACGSGAGEVAGATEEE